MTMMGALLRVTIAVEEGYRGVSAKAIEVYTPSSSAACGFAFKQGERYLVYASRTKDSVLMVSLCSSTHPAKYAEADIEYLRSLSTLPPVSTIFGTLWRYTHDPNFKPTFQPSLMDHYRPPEQDYIAMEPAPGTIVVVKGDDGAEHRAIAEADGDWRVSDLTPGRYTVVPQANDATFVHPFRASLEVAPRGCAEVDIRTESNGRISGTIDHPAAGSDWGMVKIFAVPLAEPDWHHPIREVTLEPTSAAFEIGPLPPGQYFLGAYVVTKIDVPNGYTFGNLGPLYFPNGATGLSGAEPIDVAQGKVTTNLKFRMMY